jgi:hypothetical protein
MIYSSLRTFEHKESLLGFNGFQNYSEREKSVKLAHGPWTITLASAWWTRSRGKVACSPVHDSRLALGTVSCHGGSYRKRSLSRSSPQ